MTACLDIILAIKQVEQSPGMTAISTDKTVFSEKVLKNSCVNMNPVIECGDRTSYSGAGGQ